jgi:hypothetical protein
VSELQIAYFLRVGGELLNPSTERGRARITRALCREEDLQELAETDAKGLAEVIVALGPRQRAKVVTRTNAVQAVADYAPAAALDLVESLEPTKQQGKALLGCDDIRNSENAIHSLLARGQGQQRATIALIKSLGPRERADVLESRDVLMAFEHAGLQRAHDDLRLGLPARLQRHVPRAAGPVRGKSSRRTVLQLVR